MTPMNLCQQRFYGVINSGSGSLHNTLSINTEIRDSSDKGLVELRSSLKSEMNISGHRSGNKQKSSTLMAKEKKKIRSMNLSYLVEHLASVGEMIATSGQLFQEEVPSCH
ncbi:hypothetical protein Fot_23710 [Forsythia ovata]|uniref:Uncharacterized protein n=1 Tax=Forsythia ovata TaxID=205694 RepID=A0ABD1U477_9LAMI